MGKNEKEVKELDGNRVRWRGDPTLRCDSQEDDVYDH